MSGQAPGPRAFAFVTPFASPSAVAHAGKLLDCLAAACGSVLFAGDRRVAMTPRASNVRRAAALPALGYARGRGARAALIWLGTLAALLCRACWALTRQRASVDVVVCFLGVHYTPLIAWARLLGKPVVLFEPGSERSDALTAYGSSARGRALAASIGWTRAVNRRLASRIAVESATVASAAELRRFAGKTRVATLWVDTDIFRPTTPLEARSRRIGCVGRLTPVKRVETLIAGFGMLEAPGWRLVIAGDGPLRARIAARLRERGAPNVELRGWLSGEDVPRCLNELRLLALPSAAEGLPNSVLEAMACGTPVLATPVGGVPDIIRDGENGFLLRDPSPEGIARAIDAAIASPRLAEIAAAARRDVERDYSLDAAAGRWRAIFDELREGTPR